MRVLYLTTTRLDEVAPQHRLDAMPLVLRSAGLEVVTDDRMCEIPRRMLARSARLASARNQGRVELDRCRPLLDAYALAAQIAQRRYKADAVVVGESPIVAHARLDVPLVSWTDAVFGGMVGYYPEFTGLSEGTLRRGHHQERSALRRVAAAVFLSEWAAEHARSMYDVPPEKTHVIPFGGVLDSLPSTAEVRRAITERTSHRRIGLVWLGQSWDRKGGDLAVETGEILRSRGHDTNLTLIGVTPSEAVRQLPWVQSLGRLHRSSEVERELLASTFLGSHIHLLPTRAECMGLALAEASAYGVPSVVTSTGGTSSVILDGITGLLVPEWSDAAAYAEAVERIIASPEEYVRFAVQARQDYVERLSYPPIGRRLRELLEQICDS
jgi:glycosyltransferase involved in cell wall biosynthesis